MPGASAPVHDALGLLEINSIARGYKVVDALVKKSPVLLLEANVVEPGKFLVLFSASVAEVEEAFKEAMEVAGDSCIDHLFLPLVHASILSGLAGDIALDDPDTVGIVEGKVVSSTLRACDRALKDADVTLAGLRIAPGLGGKAYFVVHGQQHDVEASLERAHSVLSETDQLMRIECIAAPHPDFLEMVLRPAPFQLERS